MNAEILKTSLKYEGRSINKLQNGAIPSVLKIGKIRNIRFVGNLILNIHTIQLFSMMTSLLWRHLAIEHSRSVYYFLHDEVTIANTETKTKPTLKISVSRPRPKSRELRAWSHLHVLHTFQTSARRNLYRWEKHLVTYKNSITTQEDGSQTRNQCCKATQQNN